MTATVRPPRRQPRLHLRLSADTVELTHVRRGRCVRESLADHQGSRRAALRQACRRLGVRPSPWRRPRTAVALPRRAVHRRTLTLPHRASRRETDAVLRLHLRRHLPRHARQWAYRITDRHRGRGEDARQDHATLTAVPCRVLQDLQRLLGEAGLRPAGFLADGDPPVDLRGAPRIAVVERPGDRGGATARPRAAAYAGALAVVGAASLIPEPPLWQTLLPGAPVSDPAAVALDGDPAPASLDRTPAPEARTPSPRDPWHALLDRVAAAVPGQAVLDRLTMRRQRGQATWTLEGHARGRGPVAALQEALAGRGTPAGLRTLRRATGVVLASATPILHFRLEGGEAVAESTPPVARPAELGSGHSERVLARLTDAASTAGLALDAVQPADGVASGGWRLTAHGDFVAARRFLQELAGEALQSVELEVDDRLLEVRVTTGGDVQP